MSEYIVDFGDDGKSAVRIAMAKQHGAELRGEIVRCRDCKHFRSYEETGKDDWCSFHEHIGWSRNGYCAWGERKEGCE